ncbi:beta strand repeat-containing protein [Qipengyuania sp. ASV99]|uniref:beta strand repeat-containing protein n=1 Tax=Qipengyuania sp. ASV99 TaxID=3399681 RepID=UPI003A4C547E
MTLLASTKIRAFGGASALALTAGLATAGLAQDMAPTPPEPVDMVPTPMAPMAPAESAECALDTMAMPNTLICGPGTDADGFQQDIDDVVVTVEEGAQVQGEIQLGDSVNATINGDFVVSDGTQSALELGTSAAVVNNGFIGGDATFNGFIITGADSAITNNGIISDPGSSGIGVQTGEGSTFVNNGLIALAGFNTFGVVGLNAVVSGDNITVMNSVTGSIIVDGQGALSAGIRLGNDADVTNDGLIQTFGNTSEGVFANDRASITNNGNIVTSGIGAEGIATGVDAVLVNTGMIATSGDDAFGVLADDNSMLDNSGSITTEGEDADAINVGDMFTLTNSGTITATGDGARGIDVDDGFTLTNSGTIEAFDRAINAGDDAAITNAAGGIINTTGDADTIQTGDNLTIVNNGTISNEGEDTKIIDAGDGLTVTNNGTITSDWKGIEGEADFTLTNNAGALIFSALDEAVEADGPGLVVVNNGEIIAPKDDAIDGGDNVTITNTGLIRGGENDGLELNSGTITNSGTIESLSSDPNGSLVIGGTVPELDAAIDFDATETMGASEDGTVTNLAGGIIRGDIGINTSAGNQDAPDTNDGVQTIVNFGTIEGRMGDAALLGNGDDVFEQWNNGVTIGIVNGEAGDDTLTFANNLMEAITRDLTFITTNFVNFETNRLLDMGGGIILTGTSGIEFDVLGGDITLDGALTSTLNIDGEGSLTLTEDGSINVDDGDAVEVDVDGFAITNAGTIAAADGRAIDARDFDGTVITNSGTIEAFDRAIDAGDDVTITNAAGGTINTTGDDDTIQTGDNLTIVNNGTISNEGFDTKIVDAGDGLTVTNNGTITSDWKGIEGEADFTLTNNAGALIFSALDEAVEADGPGLVVVNNGEIIAPKDDAIDGGDNVTITNTGLIRGGENDGLELNSGTITNSGTIISISSDPEGTPAVVDGPPELDAGIDVDAGTPGNEDATITNLAGGLIEGDIGIVASPGNIDGPTPNMGSQTVINFGTITGRLGDAALLGENSDEFRQNMGAAVNGNVNLEAGDDTFILAGTASSVDGMIIGGAGNDTAILGGVLDADNLTGFEATTLGTLTDLTITGDRTLLGDVTIDGNVILGLGADTLSATGSITLADTGIVTIATPLDFALIGQTVLVLEDGTGFTNDGGTITILDDDLLLAYTPIIGSLSVQVNAANPLANSPDANVTAFGAALTGAVAAGTLSQANFDLLNGLAGADQLQSFALDALPSLSEGAAREIFETSGAASQALNRHLAGETSGIWGQFIVRGAEQDGVAASQGGYDSDQLIFTVGGDFAFGEMGRFGVLASYADIDNADLTGNGQRGQTEIKSYKFGAYGAITLGERGFVNGELAYLTGEIDENRSGLFGSIGSAYDFDGFAYSAVVGFDLLPDANVAFTPSVGINGARINFDDVVEAGGFGFGVVREDADFLELRGSLELAAQVSPGVNGFVRGTAVRDLEDDVRRFTLSSAQLGTFAVAVAPRQTDRLELAAGANVNVSDAFSIELGYLGDFADGYNAHSARATARFAF